MEWRDLTFHSGDRELLGGVTGMLRRGRLTALMGPSGCGKTTLMNVLSGRQRTSGRAGSGGSARQVRLKGDITLEGRSASAQEVRSAVAYVFQDGGLPETETPRELLAFAAYLRLPRQTTASERQAKVDAALEGLRLEKCADVAVGSVHRKGLSGGEQKRAAVAMELLWGPRILFLDEPLSGLDAFTAHSLVKTLKQLAATGVSVLLSLHQPSSQVFSEIDDLVLLHKGSTCYCGPVPDMLGHFGALGFDCPPTFNPADFAMFTILGQPLEVVQQIKQAWPSSAVHKDLLALINTVEEVQAPDCIVMGLEKGSEGTSCEDRKARRSRSGAEAFVALLGRDLRWLRRRRSVLAWHWGVNALVALSYGWIYLDAGRQPTGHSAGPSCRDDNFNAGACRTYMGIYAATISVIGSNTLIAATSLAINLLHQEREVFLRERAGGYYGVVPFFLSKSILEIPMVLVDALIRFLALYWLVGMRGSWPQLVALNALMALSTTSAAYCFSAFATSMEQAVTLCLLPQILQMLFTGLTVPVALIRPGLLQLRLLSPLYYGLRMMMVAEFEHVFLEVEECHARGQECVGLEAQLAALQIQEVKPGSFWQNMAMLLLLMVAYRTFAMMILSWRTRYAV